MEKALDRPSILDRPLVERLALDWEKVAYIAILLLAVLTRFWDLGSRAQHHDESMHAYYSWELYQGRGYIHNPLLHGPFLFEITALVYFLLGASDYTARVAPAVFGVAMVAMPYFLRRWLGKGGALATSFLLALSPGFLYFTRFIRHDVFAAGFEFLLFIALIKYLAEKKDSYLYLAVAALALLFSTMEIGFITSFIFATFFWLVLQFIAWQRLRPDQGVRYFLASTLGTILLLAGAVFLLSSSPPVTVLVFLLAIVGGGILWLQSPAIVAFFSRVQKGWNPPPLEAALQDLVIILGTFTITLTSALPMRLLGLDPMSFVSQFESGGAVGRGLFSDLALWKAAAIFLLVLGAAFGLGVLWDRRRWLSGAGIFFGIYLLLQTTFLTNMLGIFTGMIGSLGYWLAQHNVRRGSQPEYYYAILLPLYEFFPLALAFLGTTSYLLRLRRPKAAGSLGKELGEGEASISVSKIFTPLLIYWSAMAFATYSWAGEKMPWLILHLALPLILLAGNTLGRWLRNGDWGIWRKSEGWALFALVIVATLVGVASLFSFPSLASFPSLGSTLEELNRSMRFLGYLGLLLAIGYLAYKLWRRLGKEVAQIAVVSAFLLIMSLLTVRYGFIAAYQHGDIAQDMLIYTQTTPDVTMLIKEVDSLSQRLAGGKNLAVAFDDFTSWPLWWYLRDYPNKIYFGSQPSGPLDAPVVFVGLENEPKVRPYLVDYIRQQYRLRWWFPEDDYRNLSPERIAEVLQDAEQREDFLRFIFYREISRPLGSSDFAFYLRRDIASQLWRSSAIPLGPQVALASAYSQVEIERTSLTIFGNNGAGPGQFNYPKDLALDGAGRLYVLDTMNHRLQVLALDGSFIRSWGGQGLGPGEFNEPWGIAVDQEHGSVYVADTWNHRIQKFGLEGNFLAGWGSFGDSGGKAEGSEGLFYGPRDVVVDGEGNIYVVDTGNKRIQKFSPEGTFLGQWGGEGTGSGQFREPVGIAIGPDGKIYVADAWNQRIQIFDQDFNFLAEWPLQTWQSTSVDNKPYLAVDSRGQVYASDPEGYRILVFDQSGQVQAVFGQYGSDAKSFNLPTGLALDGQGYLYVADSANHRIMKFAPLDSG